MRALVVIPTYDEAGSIGEVIERVLAADQRAEVLVVDDASPDGTGDLVARRAAGEPRLHLLRRPGKQGLGVAYRAGFAWGLARGYDALIEMDADLSHPPERLPELIDGLDHADLVIGSRYVPGGRTVNWPSGSPCASQSTTPPRGSAPTAASSWRPCRWSRSSPTATASRSRWPTAAGRRASAWSRSRSPSPNAPSAPPR